MNTEALETHSRRPSILRSIGLGLATIAAIVTISACGDARRADASDHLAPPPASSAVLTPPIERPTAYRSDVIETVAGAIHASPDEIRTELGRDTGATLMNVAKPLGLDQDQLAQILLSAVKEAGDAQVSAQTWTTQQAAQEQQFWAGQPEGSLIAEISRWFGQP